MHLYDRVKNEALSTPVSFIGAMTGFLSFGSQFFLPKALSANESEYGILATFIVILGFTFALVYAFTIFVRQMSFGGWVLLQVVVAVSALGSASILPSLDLGLAKESLTFVITLISQMATGVIYAVALFRGLEIQKDNLLYYWLGGIFLSVPMYEKTVSVVGYGIAVFPTTVEVLQ